METEPHVQIYLSISDNFVEFFVLLQKFSHIIFQWSVNLILWCWLDIQNVVGKIVTMSELNSLSSYILHVNINHSNVVEIGAALYYRHVIDALFENDVVMPTENKVDFLDMGRVKTVGAVSHVSQGDNEVAMVFFPKNFTDFSRMFDMVVILDFSIVHGR